MAYAQGEVTVKLDGSTLAGVGAYAVSDGWIDHNGQEQFILFSADGKQFGRYGEREVRNFEIRSTK